MRYIDSFCHYFPQAIFQKLQESPAGSIDIGKRMQSLPTVWNIDARMKMMEPFQDYTQVISLGLPPLEVIASSNVTPDLAKAVNDGYAELCAKYPDRFAGYVGALPMDNPDAAANEAERILVNGNANGVQLHTNVNGHCLDEPQFLPIFEIAAKSGKPILLHPARLATFPDFAAEKKSRYEIWTIFGWPYETSATMARLVFSGVMTKFPDIKILTHHLGAMIPFFDARIDTGWRQLGIRSSDEDLSKVLPSLGKPLIEVFRQFYGDTALCGSRGGIACGIEFFGPDHVLFGSDAPFGQEQGAAYIRLGIEAIESLDLKAEDREKICYRNALSFFGLK